MYPTGKGMFVRNWSITKSPAQAVAKAKAAGLAWVSPLYGWWGVGKKAPRNVSQAKRYGDAFRAAGIEVWPWIYPVPGREAEVAAAIKRAVAHGDDGIILDPEAEYRSKPGDAAQLMQVARNAASGLPIGVSSYGYTNYHPTFPFSVFASADFGVPQVYDLKDTQKASYQRRGVESWQKAGFKAVIPALTTASSSAAEVAAEFAQTPVPNGGLVFWDWQTTNGGEWAAIRAIPLGTNAKGIALVAGSLVAVAGLTVWFLNKRG